MTEPISPSATGDSDAEIAAAEPRNWKKLAIYGAGGVLVAGLGIGVSAGIMHMLRPPKAVLPAAHEISIAAPVAATAPAAVKSAPEVSTDDKELLQAEVDQLQAQKRRLLREQAELQRQKEAMIMRQQGLSGEKQCQLSGDPLRRKEELRACFGLSSLIALPSSLPSSLPVATADVQGAAAMAAATHTPPPKAAPAAVSAAVPAKTAATGSLQSLQGHLDHLPAVQTKQLGNSKAPLKAAAAPKLPAEPTAH